MREFLSLRETAFRLNKVKEYYKRNKPYGLLLKLLQNGELVAFVKFPSKKSPFMQVDHSFWDSVTVSSFRTTLVDGDEGTWMVPVSKLISSYVEWLTHEQNLSGDPLFAEELKSAFEATRQKREPVIKSEDVDLLLKDKEPNTVKAKELDKSNAGRKEKESWKDVFEITISLLLKNPNLLQRLNELPSRILEANNKGGGNTNSMLTVSSIEKVIKKARSLED